MNVPKNREVKNLADVKNVVLSAVLRQKDEFSKRDILEVVEANVKHSAYGKYGRKRAEISLEKVIDEVLDVLWSTDKIRRNIRTNKFYLHMSFPAVK